MKLMENDQFPDAHPTSSWGSGAAALDRGWGRTAVWAMLPGETSSLQRSGNGIIQRFHPQCVDMESATVAQVCWFFGTPLLVDPGSFGQC